MIWVGFKAKQYSFYDKRLFISLLKGPSEETATKYGEKAAKCFYKDPNSFEAEKFQEQFVLYILQI